MIPDCGPPINLSPLKKARSTPASKLSLIVGSCGRPNFSVSSKQPLPKSSSNKIFAFLDKFDSSLSLGFAVKPTILKFDW